MHPMANVRKAQAANSSGFKVKRSERSISHRVFFFFFEMKWDVMDVIWTLGDLHLRWGTFQADDSGFYNPLPIGDGFHRPRVGGTAVLLQQNDNWRSCGLPFPPPPLFLAAHILIRWSIMEAVVLGLYASDWCDDMAGWIRDVFKIPLKRVNPNSLKKNSPLLGSRAAPRVVQACDKPQVLNLIPLSRNDPTALTLVSAGEPFVCPSLGEEHLLPPLLWVCTFPPPLQPTAFVPIEHPDTGEPRLEFTDIFWGYSGGILGIQLILLGLARIEPGDSWHSSFVLFQLEKHRNTKTKQNINKA